MQVKQKQVNLLLKVNLQILLENILLKWITH